VLAGESSGSLAWTAACSARVSVMDDPEINGFGHIDFTVTDVDRSVAWWERGLGFRLVFE